jgi:hypothetical protein
MSTQKPMNDTRFKQMKGESTSLQQAKELSTTFFADNFLKYKKIANPQDITENVMLRHVPFPKDFINLLQNEVKSKLEKGLVSLHASSHSHANLFSPREPISLIVIDSIAGLCNDFLRTGKGGLQEYDTFERSIFLKQITQLLKSFAYEYKICILITNNVSANFAEEEKRFIKKDRVLFYYIH